MLTNIAVTNSVCCNGNHATFSSFTNPECNLYFIGHARCAIRLPFLLSLASFCPFIVGTLTYLQTNQEYTHMALSFELSLLV